MGFFEVDGKLACIVSRIFDLIKLNFLCLIMCLPVITVGASLTAAWYILLKMVRNEESYIGKSYWKAFKGNFRQATIIWVLLASGFSVIRMDLAILKDAGSEARPVQAALLFIFWGLGLISLYIFPMLARFDNAVKNTIKNAFYMAFCHLPYTVLIVSFFLAGPVLCILNWRLFGYYILYMVLIGITGPGYLSAILFRKMFDDFQAKKGSDI